MLLRHRVALDGVELDSIDDRIMISKIETADGKENISTVSLWSDGVGSRVTSIHRDSLDVTVKFRIRLKKRNMAEREEVIEKVNAWAFAGGWLTTNYKNMRRIRVFRAQAAGAGDPWEWTKEYSIIFRACGCPYWQDSLGVIYYDGNVSTKTINHTVQGSAKAAITVSFTNNSGSTCDTFSVNAGETSMSFSSLGLASGEKLVIDRTDNGKRCLLRIRIQGTGGSWRSAMSKRSTGSSDDLLVSPGERTIVVTAQRVGTLQVGIIGRYA